MPERAGGRDPAAPPTHTDRAVLSDAPAQEGPHAQLHPHAHGARAGSDRSEHLMTGLAVADVAHRPPAGTGTSTHPLSRALAARRPLVFGILNVTPDSFSDGGRFDSVDRAVEHG